MLTCESILADVLTSWIRRCSYSSANGILTDVSPTVVPARVRESGSVVGLWSESSGFLGPGDRVPETNGITPADEDEKLFLRMGGEVADSLVVAC